MKLHKEDGPPCSHMEGLLNQAADGSSKGLKRWYANSHAAGCTRCGNYLHRLEETREQLHAAGHQPPNQDVIERLKTVLEDASSP